MTSHPLRARDYLGHMLDAVQQIQSYTREKTAADFLADRLLQDAVFRNIEILGEASRRLIEDLPDCTTRFPGIPFAAIYAMRNQLSDGYFTIDLDIVWRVVERDVPDLKEKVKSAIKELDRPLAP